MRSKLAISVLATSAIVFMCVTPSFATSYSTSPVACRSVWGGDLAVYANGVFNMAPWQATAHCGLQWSGTNHVTTSWSATVYYYDKSSGSLQENSVGCSVIETTTAGVTYYGTSKHSCSTPGGCSAPSFYYGTGYLTLNAPVEADVTYLGVSCGVAKYTSGTNWSSIFGIRLDVP